MVTSIKLKTEVRTETNAVEQWVNGNDKKYVDPTLHD